MAMSALRSAILDRAWRLRIYLTYSNGLFGAIRPAAIKTAKPAWVWPSPNPWSKLKEARSRLKALWVKGQPLPSNFQLEHKSLTRRPHLLTPVPRPPSPVPIRSAAVLGGALPCKCSPAVPLRSAARLLCHCEVAFFADEAISAPVLSVSAPQMLSPPSLYAQPPSSAAPWPPCTPAPQPPSSPAPQPSPSGLDFC